MPTVFWVEDNALDVQLMRLAFETAGLSAGCLFVVPDAVRAFRYLDRDPAYSHVAFPPDLALIDINLPAIRGTTVLQECRRILPSVPALILTSSEDPVEHAWCQVRGARQVITKPRDIKGFEELAHRINLHLPPRGASRRLQVGRSPRDEPPSSPRARSTSMQDPL